MAKKVALIDKMPNKTKYGNWFDFEFDHYHMSSVYVTKLLKKDVDLEIDLDQYDLVILVGSEAAKEYAKIGSVTTHAGNLINDRFIPIINPAMLDFKPEGKPQFMKCVDTIKKFVNGEITLEKVVGDYGGINDRNEAVKFFREVLDNASQYVAWDTETTALYPRDGYVLGVSMSYKPNHGRYVLTDCMDELCLSLLQKIADKFTTVFHNMKFDFKMIKYHLGVDFDRKRVHDTMVMHYALDENDQHGLKHLALKYTKFGDYDSELDTFKKSYCKSNGIKEEDFTYDLIPFDVISNYASIDTAVTFELFNKFWPVIQKNEKVLKVYTTLLIPGTLFLMDMEEVGIPIDKTRMAKAKGYLDDAILDATQKIYTFDEVINFEKIQQKQFNPASPMQLRSLLFDYVGLNPTGKKTGTGAVSTDKEVLEELSSDHPLPRQILEMRKLTKIQTTYINKILPEINRDGRIRTNFNLIFTTSGRLSSSGKFNAQQIPRDDPIIKGCIKAPAGYKIVSQDLRTAEVYYAAVLSGDKALQEVFKLGGDLHSTIAKMVFGLDCDVSEVKTKYSGLRQAAKAITFGINV